MHRPLAKEKPFSQSLHLLTLLQLIQFYGQPTQEVSSKMLLGLQPQESPKNFSPEWQVVGLHTSLFKESKYTPLH